MANGCYSSGGLGACHSRADMTREWRVRRVLSRTDSTFRMYRM
jgi:hypothetical protein